MQNATPEHKLRCFMTRPVMDKSKDRHLIVEIRG